MCYYPLNSGRKIESFAYTQVVDQWLFVETLSTVRLLLSLDLSGWLDTQSVGGQCVFNEEKRVQRKKEN